MRATRPSDGGLRWDGYHTTYFLWDLCSSHVRFICIDLPIGSRLGGFTIIAPVSSPAPLLAVKATRKFEFTSAFLPVWSFSLILLTHCCWDKSALSSLDDRRISGNESWYKTCSKCNFTLHISHKPQKHTSCRNSLSIQLQQGAELHNPVWYLAY